MGQEFRKTTHHNLLANDGEYVTRFDNIILFRAIVRSSRFLGKAKINTKSIQLKL